MKRRRQAVGAETLLGREAVVMTACQPRGQVRIDGEIWDARCDAVRLWETPCAWSTGTSSR